MDDQLWIHVIVVGDFEFSFRTIQLGAAPSMDSISGVYSDSSIFTPCPSSSLFLFFLSFLVFLAFLVFFYFLFQAVTGQEASGSGSSGD